MKSLHQILRCKLFKTSTQYKDVVLLSNLIFTSSLYTSIAAEFTCGQRTSFHSFFCLSESCLSFPNRLQNSRCNMQTNNTHVLNVGSGVKSGSPRHNSELKTNPRIIRFVWCSSCLVNSQATSFRTTAAQNKHEENNTWRGNNRCDLFLLYCHYKLCTCQIKVFKIMLP